MSKDDRVLSSRTVLPVRDSRLDGCTDIASPASILNVAAFTSPDTSIVPFTETETEQLEHVNELCVDIEKVDKAEDSAASDHADGHASTALPSTILDVPTMSPTRPISWLSIFTWAPWILLEESSVR
jgi:hypothetical protein